MRTFSKLTFVALATFILGACQKQVEHVGTPDPQPVLPDPIAATLQGNVLDETGAPAQNVTVTVGSRTVLTDNRGFFRITGAALDKNMALVTASKSGYFKAYRSFAATSGANQVQIKLLKRNLAGTVPAAAGGEATVVNGGGSKVALQGGGVVVASSGASYTGNVKVYAAYIDPTQADLAQTVPGSLMANAANGERVTLNSYGMLAVELEGDNGEKLQVKSGSAATLTTAIPTAAQASAPATIPTWSLDEATGVWKQEGTATKQGNVYVGTVSHFSFWNCDVSASAVTIQVTINGPNGQPLPNVAVRLTRPNQYWSSSYGWTDSVGVVRGLVPANEQLALAVLDPCWNAVYTANIGPFSQSTTLTPITATIPNASLTNITGKLLNCAAAPVTNGYALVSIGGQVRYVGVDASGNFAVQMLNCGGSTSIDIVGIDVAAQVQSSNQSFTITPGTTNVGNINVCGISATEFINYNVDGTNYGFTSSTAGDSLYMYTRPVQGSTNWMTSIYGYRVGGSQDVSFSFTGANTTGTYTATGVSVNGQQSSSSNVTVTVTAWPAMIGDFMQGSFTGTYVVSGTTKNLSGSFKMRRNF